MFAIAQISAQVAKVSYKSFQHYNDRVEEFRKMAPIDSTNIVMLGNSLTENGGDWNVKLGVKRVKNRGISGDNAIGILNRLQQILPGKPRTIFLMIGINDLSQGQTPQQVYARCVKVINTIRTQSPKTQLYIQSLLPINESFNRWKLLEGKTNDIPLINQLLESYCRKKSITFIPLFDKFVRKGSNELRKELTIDGLHLSEQGYKLWSFELRRYVQ